MAAAILVVGIVVVAAAVAAAALIPAGGLAGYNVSVSVTNTELSYVIGTYFQVTAVSGTTNGPSSLIPLNAYLSNAPFAVHGSFTEKVTIAGHSASLSSSQWFPTVPVLNGASFQATTTFIVTQVPQGCQGISVVLTQNGQTVATGSGTMNVNGAGSGC